MSFNINKLESLQNYHWMYKDEKLPVKCLDCHSVLDDDSDELCRECNEFKEWVNQYEREEK